MRQLSVSVEERADTNELQITVRVPQQLLKREDEAMRALRQLRPPRPVMNLSGNPADAILGDPASYWLYYVFRLVRAAEGIPDDVIREWETPERLR